MRHDQGILHRDIKPANLLIDEDQVAWITDFGLAKLIGRDDLTHSGDVIGTLRYLAPEALRGQTDHRSDLYSLGLTLYEVLTLHSPFGDLSPSELLRCVTEEQPARPRTLDRNIPLDLETIVLKATAREPVNRYATAAALADDLRAFLDDRPILARRATPVERLNRWCRRNKLVAAMTAIAAVSLLAATVVGWAMYAERTRALERSEANVALSLEALNSLFDQLADRDEFGPVMVGLGLGPPSGDRPPPSGRPGGFRDDLNEEKDAALLQSILVFYDRFAERNETNSRLQLEAARSLRKVAALYGMLGRYEEADKALAHAAQRFETLIASEPDVPLYRFELARVYAMDDQHREDPIEPVRTEQGIRKALLLVQRLADESSKQDGSIMYIMALARWKARLGDALQRQNRLTEAETAYRESIAHDESLVDQVPFAGGVQMVLATNREALALILLARGQRTQAKELLDQAADRLLSIRGHDRHKPGADGHLADRLDSLAETYYKLGDTGRAGECEEQAQRFRPKRPGDGPGRREGRPPRQGGPGPRHDQFPPP